MSSFSDAEWNKVHQSAEMSLPLAKRWASLAGPSGLLEVSASGAAV
jgi:hypothetical protein